MLDTGNEVGYVVEILPSAEPELFKRLTQQDISSFVLGLSHVNIIVEDVDSAADYYHKVLGFERAIDAQGEKMDYRNISMNEFNQDAGLAKEDVKVDVLFLSTLMQLSILNSCATRALKESPKFPRNQKPTLWGDRDILHSKSPIAQPYLIT